MGSASASSHYEDQYETVIDVTDVGADNNGNESITPILREHASNDTLLKFPSGRYRMDSQFRLTGFDNFGMVGDDAVLEPASYGDFETDDWNYRLFRLGTDEKPGTNLRMEGFTVDQSADRTGVRAIDAAIDDGLIVRDIDINGYHDSGAWGPGRFVITDADGAGLVERFRAPDGAATTGNAPGDKLWRGPSGILCNMNKGTITFRNCVLEGFPDNGLYAAHGSGSVRVEGGRYKNNMGANVRLGGDHSYIMDATIVVDQDDNHGIYQRGLRLEKGNLLVAKDVDFETRVGGSPAIRVANNADNVYVLDSSITTQTDGPSSAIDVRPSAGKTYIKRSDVKHATGGGPAITISDGDSPVFLEKLNVSTNSATSGTRSAIHNERDGCEFRAVNVSADGGSGRRALTISANNCTVYEGNYVSPDHPLQTSGSGTWIESVSARSKRGDEALLITSSADDTYVKNSTLQNGIDDRGGYSGYGNEF